MLLDCNHDVEHFANNDEQLPTQSNQFKNNIIGMLLQTLSVFFLITAYALFQYASNHMNISLFECIITANIIQNITAWILWYLSSYKFILQITQKSKYNILWYGEKEYRKFIWLRGFFYCCDLYLYWKGISLVPLGDAEAIYYLCPIFVAFGGRIFLKETFPKTIVIILILITIGLIFISQPKWLINIFNHNVSNSNYYISNSINILGLISLILGCFAWAAMSLMVRKAQKAHWLQLEIVGSFQAFVIWAPILILISYIFNIDLDNNGTVYFTFKAFGIMTVIGLLTMIGLLFSVLSYQIGETTQVSWMEYINLPLGYLYQVILTNSYPNVYETIGGCIVMSTCFIGFIEQYCQYKKHIKQSKQYLVERDNNNIQYK
eukprot:501895_1